MKPRTAGGEPEPLWAEVVDRVICDGRPAFLRVAADRYEHLLRRMHDEATAISDQSAELAESWHGEAFAAYHTAVETIVADLRHAAAEARGMTDALRLAADLLRGHQELVPVPVRLGSQVFRAHHQRRESAGGLAPSNADFEQAVHADIVEQAPWLAGPQALEQAAVVFQEQQIVARRVYRELSAAYADVEALLPALPQAQVAPTHTPRRTHAPQGKSTIDWSDRELTLGGEIGELETDVIDLPVPVELGGIGVQSRVRAAGHLSGGATGPALGGGATDTGAAFGVPVSMMSTPGANTGVGMGTTMGGGTGAHMNTPMATGYGGVIGGFGEGETHSTWLTDENDPFEPDESSGAVLS